MKPSKDQIRFVIERAREAVQVKVDAYRAELCKQSAKEELAKAQEIIEFTNKAIARLDEEKKAQLEACRKECAEILKVSTADLSYWGGYPQEGGTNRIIAAYQSKFESEIRKKAEAHPAFATFRDFELEVVLSDSKELAKVLDKFLKRLK